LCMFTLIAIKIYLCECLSLSNLVFVDTFMYVI